MSRTTLPPAILQALEASGLPWQAEEGGKHVKLRLAGRLVGIISRTGSKEGHKRTILNTVAQISRMAKQLEVHDEPRR